MTNNANVILLLTREREREREKGFSLREYDKHLPLLSFFPVIRS